MIQVRNLTVSYGTTSVLQNVSFEVKDGECLVVTGSSGCGKSTLAHVLTGLIPNSIPAKVEGVVNINEIDVLQSSVEATARQVGIVFQNPRAHLFHLRLDDEVAFGPRNLGFPEDEVSVRVDWALNAVGLWNARANGPS